MKKTLPIFCIIVIVFCILGNMPDTKAQGMSDHHIVLKGVNISEIYPNPADDIAHFDYVIPNDKQSASVEIFNLIGTVVWTKEIQGSDGTVSIVLNEFKKGIYFYRLEVAGEKTPIRKLIVR